MNFDINTIFKIAVTIVVIGFGYKIIKSIASIVFKLAIVVVVVLIIAKIFIR